MRIVFSSNCHRFYHLIYGFRPRDAGRTRVHFNMRIKSVCNSAKATGLKMDEMDPGP